MQKKNDVDNCYEFISNFISKKQKWKSPTSDVCLSHLNFKPFIRNMGFYTPGIFVLTNMPSKLWILAINSLKLII